jgi:hypothetical protein
MANIEHSDVVVGEVHVVSNWIAADATARLALVLIASDVGKVCWQQDNDTFWILKATTPTWVQQGRALIVKDEGVVKSSQALSVDFVGAGVTVTNTVDAITVTIPAESHVGDVTSVAMSVPSILAVAGSPITSTGTLAVTLATQAANKVFVGPASGADATPTFRSLTVDDLPAAVVGALEYQGGWNATTNSPTIPAAAAGNKGHYYVVTTAGTTSVDGNAVWTLKDWIISNGTTWDILQGGVTSAEVLTALGYTPARLDLAQVFTKTQSGSPVALTVSANAVAVDLSLGNNFSLSLQATTGQALSNPTNIVAGTSGQIAITQNATPSTLAYDTYWIEASSGSATAVSTTASAQNLLSYYVFDTTHIYYVLNKHGVA